MSGYSWLIEWLIFYLRSSGEFKRNNKSLLDWNPQERSKQKLGREKKKRKKRFVLEVIEFYSVANLSKNQAIMI